MAQHHFSVTHRPVTKAVATKRDRIARKVGGRGCGCGCGYISVRLPEGPRAWGYCPNLGEPFDRATAREIVAAWNAAGV